MFTSSAIKRRGPEMVPFQTELKSSGSHPGRRRAGNAGCTLNTPAAAGRNEGKALNFSRRWERTDPRSLGGLRRDQSPTRETKPCWDGHKVERGGENGWFCSSFAAGLVLPCLLKITNMERADFLPDLAPLIYQITELLQSFKLQSRAGGTGDRLQPQLQALVLNTEARAEMFAAHGTGFAPEKKTKPKTTQLKWFVWFFCLFSCNVRELEDKVYARAWQAWSFPSLPNLSARSIPRGPGTPPRLP